MMNDVWVYCLCSFLSTSSSLLFRKDHRRPKIDRINNAPLLQLGDHVFRDCLSSLLSSWEQFYHSYIYVYHNDGHHRHHPYQYHHFYLFIFIINCTYIYIQYRKLFHLSSPVHSFSDCNITCLCTARCRTAVTIAWWIKTCTQRFLSQTDNGSPACTWNSPSAKLTVTNKIHSWFTWFMIIHVHPISKTTYSHRSCNKTVQSSFLAQRSRQAPQGLQATVEMRENHGESFSASTFFGLAMKILCRMLCCLNHCTCECLHKVSKHIQRGINHFSC